MKKFIFTIVKACASICVFATISTASFCQKFKYLTAEKNVKNPVHSLNRNSDGGIFDVSYNYKDRNFTATAGDADLKSTVVKDLDFLNDQTYQFSCLSAGKLYMFAKDKHQSLLKFEVNPATFALIGSPENVFSFDDDVLEYRFAYSPDSAYFSLLCRHHNKKSSDDNFSGIVYNSALTKVGKYEFSPLVPVSEIVAIDFVLSENGTAAVICKGAKQKKKADDEVNNSATVAALNGNASSKLISGFPAGSNQNLHWSFSKNDLVFEGLLGASAKEGFTKAAAGRYNMNSGAVEELKLSAFSGPDWAVKSNSPSADQIKQKGIPYNVALKYAFHGSDNAAFLIFDLGYQSTVQDFHMPGEYTPKFAEFTSLETYVIKLDGAKNPGWFHAISKKQVEVAGQLFTGINYILGKDNALYIFFHDNSDNEEVFTDKKLHETYFVNVKKSSLACITIKPAGSISKSFLWQNGDAESSMMPGTSLENKTGEVTFVAIKKTKDGYYTLSKLKIEE